MKFRILKFKNRYGEDNYIVQRTNKYFKYWMTKKHYVLGSDSLHPVNVQYGNYPTASTELSKWMDTFTKGYDDNTVVYETNLEKYEIQDKRENIW